MRVTPTGWEIEYDEDQPEQRSEAEEQITQLVLGHAATPGYCVTVEALPRDPRRWFRRRIKLQVRRAHEP